MEERYFYHSFPRRWKATDTEITKGLQILSAIRDFGLLLTPEMTEWRHPHGDGSPPRGARFLQKRVSFTDLAPEELSEHAKEFGKFALEFNTKTLRSLGGIPVFYIPQADSQSQGAEALGSTLIIQLLDAKDLIDRLSKIDSLLASPQPKADRINITPTFTGNPHLNATFNIDTRELGQSIQALKFGFTPPDMLAASLGGILNFFYPADDIDRNGPLAYYRQREWRITGDISINGRPIMRLPTPAEMQQLSALDSDFFSRELITDFGPRKRIDETLVYPGFAEKKMIQLATRIIVPRESLTTVNELLGSVPNLPPVVALETL
jgi:hypothetical protein